MKTYKIKSGNLIDALINNGYIELIGLGDRCDDRFSGLGSDVFKSDNTYNWDMEDFFGDGDNYFFSNDFEIRETEDVLVLSKHVGTDIRSGYQEDRIFVKLDKRSFLDMVIEALSYNDNEIVEEVEE